MLSVATSIDALGVGLGSGLWDNGFLGSGVDRHSAGAMTWLAMKLGNMSGRFARRMEIFGGLILIAIAFKLLFMNDSALVLRIGWKKDHLYSASAIG